MAEANSRQGASQRIYEEGKILISYLISYKLGQSIPPESSTATILRKLSDDIEQRNPSLLQQMCSRLKFSKETVYAQFCEVAQEMFEDHITNWGRIAVLFTFVAQVAKYCNENSMSDQIENIKEWTARFVSDMDLIQLHGGWEGFNRHFESLNGSSTEYGWW